MRHCGVFIWSTGRTAPHLRVTEWSLYLIDRKDYTTSSWDIAESLSDRQEGLHHIFVRHCGVFIWSTGRTTPHLRVTEWSLYLIDRKDYTTSSWDRVESLSDRQEGLHNIFVRQSGVFSWLTGRTAVHLRVTLRWLYLIDRKDCTTSSCDRVESLADWQEELLYIFVWHCGVFIW